MQILEYVLGVAEQLGIGLLGTALGVVITWLFTRVRKEMKYRDYLSVFGGDVKQPDRIFIRIPLWKVKSASRDVTRYLKESYDGRVEEYYGPSEMVSFEDHEAGTHIEHIIAEFQKETVEYILDNDQKFDETGRSVIMLGSPIANSRARVMLDMWPNPFVECIVQEETAEHPAALAFSDIEDEVVYDSAGDREYSIIFRTPNPNAEDGYFFFICGAHANGTVAAAKHLKYNWIHFKNAEPTAGMLLEMPKNSRNCHVLKKYGFRAT